jgi:hypothetical protein
MWTQKWTQVDKIKCISTYVPGKLQKQLVVLPHCQPLNFQTVKYPLIDICFYHQNECHYVLAICIGYHQVESR